VLTLAAPSVRAQAGAGAAAQALFDQGKALMADGKASEACPKFEESQRLDPSSGTLINLALCYEKTGRTASAWSTYRDAAAMARTTGNSSRERVAREHAEALAPKVSKLKVEVPADSRIPGLAVMRDGVEVGPAQWGEAIPTDEGDHALSARAPGYEDWHARVSVAPRGTSASVTVPRLAKVKAAPAVAVPATKEAASSSGAPAPEKSSSGGLGAQRIGALALGGAGVAAIVVGSVFGIKALSNKSEADKTCDGTTCSTDGGVAAGNDAHAAGNVSTITLICGAVALAGGATLWLTAPSTSRNAAKVGVTPGGVLVRAVF
jgi:hypothetical protein